MLHLCFHLAYKHLFAFYPLRSLCDIAWLTHKGQLDWDRFCRAGHECSGTHILYLTLRLAYNLTGATVPAAVLEDLEPQNFNPQLLAWAEECIFHFAITGQTAWMTQLETSQSSPGNQQLVRFARQISFFRVCFPPLPALARKYKVPPNSSRFRLYSLYLKRFLEQFGDLKETYWLLRGGREARAWLEQEANKNALISWMTVNSAKRDKF